MRTLLSCILFLCITITYSQTEFITTWKTDNPGASGDNQITIPTFSGETYDYTVDWGDGIIESNLTSDATHSYASSGLYQVTISGIFPRIYFRGNEDGSLRGDEQKILSIDQWGTREWSSMSSAFAGCINLDMMANDIPNLTATENLSGMFLNCQSLIGNLSMGQWNISNAIWISGMFQKATLFNQPIGDWDVSQVINMFGLFNEAASFNQPIGNWDVSQVKTTAYTFREATSFNQNINNWNVSNVTDMQGMFLRASSFNKEIGDWDVSNVTSMHAMFNTAIFNRDISKWEVSNVTDMSFMFHYNKYFNQDITGWNVSNVINMNWMFGFESPFNQNIGLWNISNVENMTHMFDNSVGLSVENYNKILIGWSNLPDVKQNVTFDAEAYQYCDAEVAREKLVNDYGWIINDNGKNCIEGQRPYITVWKTDNFGITDDNQIEVPTYRFGLYDFNIDWGDGTTDENVRKSIIHTYSTPGIYEVKITGYFPNPGFTPDAAGFYYADGKDRDKIIAVKQWGDINWVGLNDGFVGCKNLDVIATDAPDLTNITQLYNVFNLCESLIGNEIFNDWDVSNIQRFDYLFSSCTLFNQDISSWDITSAENVSEMFSRATNFNQDISVWDMSNVKYFSGMFQGATNFNQNIKSWDVSSGINFSRMFYEAEQFNFNLDKWDISNAEDLSIMFYDSGLSTNNYDATLIGWSELSSLQNDVLFDAGNSQYCEGSAARQFIINNYNWTINDLGQESDCTFDSDNDGVPNYLDICPNTAAGELTDIKGCEVISSNSLSVYAENPSCIGKNNGIIIIHSSLVSYNYDIKVTSNNFERVFTSRSLDEELTLNELSSGSYFIEISIPQINFTQTYGIQINEVGSISGKRESLNTAAKTATYNVEGSYMYTVDINGELKNFSFTTNGINEIQLTDLAEFNAISITGESDCQGMVTDSFAFSDGVIMFPTITSGEVFIQGNEESSTVLVYDLSGKLILSKTLSEQGLNSIDLQVLETGIYPTVIKSKQHSKTFKIIKK
tara:strand:- start:7391 stop:10438 length:3048 start_codon:yes stop_codon:yes gene_type:complete